MLSHHLCLDFSLTNCTDVSIASLGNSDVCCVHDFYPVDRASFTIQENSIRKFCQAVQAVKLERLAIALGDPVARKLESKKFAAYRSVRIASGIAPKTMNNELAYLDSLYNSLNKIGEIDYSNPIESVDMMKIDERELSWLTVEQINCLLSKMDEFSINPHVKILTKISLATGARWGRQKD